MFISHIPYFVGGFHQCGYPPNGWFIMENTVNTMKMDDLGVPLFQETSKSSWIWVNNNNSLTWIKAFHLKKEAITLPWGPSDDSWIKAIWGWFPLLAMITVRSQWGRSEVVIIYPNECFYPQWRGPPSPPGPTSPRVVTAANAPSVACSAVTSCSRCCTSLLSTSLSYSQATPQVTTWEAGK